MIYWETGDKCFVSRSSSIEGKTDLIGWVNDVLNDAGGRGLRGSDIASMIWSWRLNKDGWQ